MSDLLVARLFLFLTLATMGINMAGWYGLWKYYTATSQKEKPGRKNAPRGSKVPGIITPIIRLEFAYYLLLVFYQLLSAHLLSSFWVACMFLYHLLGLLGNEYSRKSSNQKSAVSKRKVSILLGTIGMLDLVEFYVLITFSYRFYLLSQR